MAALNAFSSKGVRNQNLTTLYHWKTCITSSFCKPNFSLMYHIGISVFLPYSRIPIFCLNQLPWKTLLKQEIDLVIQAKNGNSWLFLMFLTQNQLNWNKGKYGIVRKAGPEKHPRHWKVWVLEHLMHLTHTNKDPKVLKMMVTGALYSLLLFLSFE